MASPRYTLAESSLSRIYRYIEDYTKSCGVVSAFLDGRIVDNEDRHKKLMAIVKDMGHGYIEMRGGYTGETGFVNEKSLFIPGISHEGVLSLGRQCDQETVIYKDRDMFAMLDARSGSVRTSFKFGVGRDNLVLARDVMKDFFSSLLKGSHGGRQFQFAAESFRLEEREWWGFFRHAYSPKGEKPGWNLIYEEVGEDQD